MGIEEQNRLTNAIIENSIQTSTEIAKYLKRMCDSNRVKDIVILVLAAAVLINAFCMIFMSIGKGAC